MEVHDLRTFRGELEKLSWGLAEARRVARIASSRDIGKAGSRRIHKMAPELNELPGALTSQRDRSKSIQGAISNSHPWNRFRARRQVGAELKKLDKTYLGQIANHPEVKKRGILIRGGKTPQDQRMQWITQSRMASLTPDQKKVLSGTIGGHELDELGTKGVSNYMTQSLGHKNLDVLLREHNRMATLPKGYEPVRDLMTNVRSRLVRGPGNTHSEVELLKRYGIDYGKPGTRISRHKRKKITQQALADMDAEQASAMRNQFRQEVAGAALLATPMVVGGGIIAKELASERRRKKTLARAPD